MSKVSDFILDAEVDRVYKEIPYAIALMDKLKEEYPSIYAKVANTKLDITDIPDSELVDSKKLKKFTKFLKKEFKLLREDDE